MSEWNSVRGREWESERLAMMTEMKQNETNEEIERERNVVYTEEKKKSNRTQGVSITRNSTLGPI